MTDGARLCVMNRFCRNRLHSSRRATAVSTAAVVLTIAGVFLLCGCQGNRRPPRGHSAAQRQTHVLLRSSYAGKPLVPVDAVFEQVGEISEDGRVNIRLTVISDEDAEDARIDIKLPGNVKLLDGELSWRGALKAGVPHVFEAALLKSKPGHFKMTATITLVSGNTSMLRKRVVLVVGAAPHAAAGAPAKGAEHAHRAVPLDEFLKKGR